jgi:YHS domain-containing protein
MKFIKCEVCDAEISDEKCLFAECKRIINGETYYFCCKRHADKFEKEQKQTQLDAD